MKIGTFSIYVIPGVLVFASVVFAQASQGIPGVDYPDYHSLPQTSFSCTEQKYIPGFYADLETQCQAFHFCFKDRKESFLCPTGTTFNQATLACDSWYASNCSLAPLLYTVNAGPAMETASKNLPMLIKLRNRSRGKSMPTSPLNIFEKMSSLYEASADPTASSQELETSRFPEESSSNVDDKSNETSPEESEVENYKRLLETLPEIEQNLQENAVIDQMYEDAESVSGEQDEGSDMDSFYDPVTGGYYMDYNPYPMEYQDSEPASDQFRSFYDYENRPDEYEALFQDNEDPSDNEVAVEPIPEDLDMTRNYEDGTNDLEFSRRQLETGKRRRRRPMYFVVEEERDPADFDHSEEAFGDEPSFQTSAEHVIEGSSEFSEESSEDETDSYESSDPKVSGKVFRQLKLQPRPEYSTKRPLTTDEFREAIIDDLVRNHEDDEDEYADEPQVESEVVTLVPSEQEILDESNEDALARFQDDQSVYLQDVTSGGDYELDSSAYGIEENVDSTADEDEESVDTSDQVDEYEERLVDDTLLIIPEESDVDVPDPSSDDVEVTEDGEYVNENYAYEQPEVENLSDQGYDVDEYEDAYQYYKSRREFPEGYRDVEPSRGAEYGYGGPYGRHYIPELYGAGEYEENEDYTDYSPEEARLAYLSSLRNRNPYSYVNQGYQQSYMDQFYGADSGYYSDDFSRHPYDPRSQASDYYASNEIGDDYVQPESSWARQYSSSEYDFEVTDAPLSMEEREADIVTDSPLLFDETEAGPEDQVEGMNVDVESEGKGAGDFDFTQDDGINEQRDAYYVFDFDEDDEGKANADVDYDPELKMGDSLLEPEVNDEGNDGVLKMDEALLEPEVSGDDYSEQLNLNEILDSEGLQTRDKSNSKDNNTIYKDDEISSESTESKDDGMQSLDFLQPDAAEEPGQAETVFDTKPKTDTWSSFVTESSPADKPVTLSSAFERLAALNAKAPQASSFNMDFSSDPRFMSNVPFSESMDFGPYGYGASMGQHYNLLNSVPQSNSIGSFSHRTGGNEQSSVPKLSSIQERLRSMKRGKFGVFKKYMSSMKNRN